MRSRRVLAVAAGALALALAACSGGTGAPPPGATGVAGTVNVYAAASLKNAFDRIAEEFVALHPDVRIVPVYDGSSTLATQILEGAPADVFASADEPNMAKAGDEVLDPRLFATNTLVIAVPAGNPAGIATLADLADATVVLCAPEVPCGAASRALLDRSGVTVSAASLEQNVGAVLTKVEAGEADAGLVYATDVAGADAAESIVPDGAGEVVNRYPIAVLAGAANGQGAEAFVAFVLSDVGRAILAESGFGPP